MLFKNIHPYLRFVRSMLIDTKLEYLPSVPYDARFFYTKSGNGIIRADKTDYKMSPGTVLFIAPGVEYHLMTPEKEVCYIAINFDFTQASPDKKLPIPPHPPHSFCKENIIAPVSFSDIECFNRVLYLEDMFSLKSQLEDIETEYARKLVLFESKISSSFSGILIKCARKATTFDTSEANETAEKILSYVYQNYSMPLTNRSIGDKFGFHPNYISAQIKRCTGIPLHRYLIRIRLERAMQLLETNSSSITDIASMCGFCDIYYFSKYFKKAFGISPSEYRRK